MKNEGEEKDETTGKHYETVVLNNRKAKVIGLVEPVVVYGRNSVKTILARVDTGATKSAIDVNLAALLELGPIKATKLVKSSEGKSIRPVVTTKISIGGEGAEADFTISSRRRMKYKLLIGQDVLKQGHFVIDPLKKIEED